MSTKKNTTATEQRKRSEKQWLAKDLNGHELLLSFVSFLTTRDNAITISAFNDSAPLAEILSEFSKFHGLVPTGRRKTRFLVTPPFLAENVKMPELKRAARMYTPEELAHNCLDTLFSTSTENQNKILRLVIGKVKETRKANESRIANDIDEMSANLKTANESIQALEMILSGKLDDLDIS